MGMSSMSRSSAFFSTTLAQSLGIWSGGGCLVETCGGSFLLRPGPRRSQPVWDWRDGGSHPRSPWCPVTHLFLWHWTCFDHAVAVVCLIWLCAWRRCQSLEQRTCHILSESSRDYFWQFVHASSWIETTRTGNECVEKGRTKSAALWFKIKIYTSCCRAILLFTSDPVFIALDHNLSNWWTLPREKVQRQRKRMRICPGQARGFTLNLCSSHRIGFKSTPMRKRHDLAFGSCWTKELKEKGMTWKWRKKSQRTGLALSG